MFNTLLYQPLFNLLIFLYNVIPGHDFGVAIIVLTILIKVLLYPISKKSIESQKAMNEIQPRIKEIQKKYKKDFVKQSQALQQLYKEYKINPFSGIFYMFIQIPIFFALFKVLRTNFDPNSLNIVYDFISRPAEINHIFLGIVNLSKANLVLAFLAGALQFIQAKMLMPKKDKQKQEGASSFSDTFQKQMVYLMPIMIFFIATKFPAGLALYWVTQTVLGIAQQYFALKKNKILENNHARPVN